VNCNLDPSTSTSNLSQNVILRWTNDWEVKKTDVNNNGGSVKFIFDFNKYWKGAPPVSAGAPSNYRLLKRSTSSGTFDTLVAQRTVSGNKVIFTIDALNVNTFFTIGTIDPSISPLPIDLTSFACKKISLQKVELNWITASEENNDYFTVERSADAKNYVAIAKVKGAGNSSVTLSYSAFDSRPLMGTSFYRVKQTDMNGTSKYSQPCIINNLQANDGSAIKVYPNPAASSVNIDLGETVATKISLINSLGETVYSANTGEQSKLRIDLSAFAGGMYLVQIQTEDARIINRKMVIQK